MKKLTSFLLLCVVSAAVAISQPTLLEHVTFENGIPAGWTASSTSNVTVGTTYASTGTKSVNMKPSSSAIVTLTSPVYNITANSGVRLQFSHIPILKNGDDYAGKLQIKVGTGDWLDLNNGGNSRTSPGDLDVTYGCGDTWASTFRGFSTSYFWQTYFGTDAISATDLQTYMTDMTSDYYDVVTWKNAIFYLSNRLSTTGTSFQIRFVIPQYTATLANQYSAGWYIDDIRLFVASTPGDEVRVPQIASKITYPNIYDYPNCSDVEVTFDLRDNNGALTNIPDSMYVEYFTEGNPTLQRATFEQNSGTIYTAYMPFAGVDSIVYWRAVINDHKGNVLTYPFCHGRYNKFRSIRPYVGNRTVVSEGYSSQTVFMNTSMNRAKYQMRYKASELIAAGYGPGKIAGISLNLVEAAAGTLLQNFKISVGQVPHSKVLDTFNPETGLTTVYSTSSYVVPSTGWTYFEFDSTYNFVWDGKSDIIINTCYQDKVGSGTTKVEAFSDNASVYYFESATMAVDACLTNFNQPNYSMNYKPNLKFNFVNTCFFEFDAAVDRAQILKPTNAVTCTDTIPTTAFCIQNQPAELKIKLRNDGTGLLKRIKVNWMLDDNTANISSIIWNGNLASGASTPYVLTNNFLPPVGEHQLKVWTEMVDADTIDWNYDNDTAMFTILVSQGAMNGVYAIGNNVPGVNANKTFSTFDKAFMMLINSGVNGPVTFKVQNIEHQYDTVQISFPTCINGVSATNTITFEAADPTSKPIFFAGNTTQPVFDLNDLAFYTFRNLRFKNNFASNANVIKTNFNTHDIKFVGCEFDNYGTAYGYTNNGEKINAMLNLNAAYNVTIDSCIFSGAANNQIYITGYSPAQSTNGIKILNSSFFVSQTQNGGSSYVTSSNIYGQYVRGLQIENNQFRTNYTNNNQAYSTVNYSVSLLSAKAKIERNNFVLEGISAMSLSAVDSSRIVNNKISLNRYTEGSAYISYAVNLLTGNYDTIAFNDIYARSLVSYDKRVVGLNLGSNQASNGNIIKNNIIVSDGYGYASVVKPLADVAPSFLMSNNVYFKTSAVTSMPLLSYNGATSTTLQQWLTQTQEQSSYYDQDPIFYSWDSLFTTNTFLCGKGEGMASVTNDYFNNARPTTTPCIGARQFLPPTSNVYVLATGILAGNFDGNNTYSDCNLGSESIFVTFKNLSADTISATNAHFAYRVTQGTNVINSTATLPYNILPDSVYTFTFPTPQNFVTVGTSNTTYSIKAWSAIPADTINNNDTATAQVVSFYQLPAMAAQTQNVNYGTDADLTVTTNDSVYWYYHPTDDTPFMRGLTYHTPILYHDTTFYFSLKEEIPALKITEVQINKTATAAGVTPDIPAYITSNNAVEIANLGNGDLDMSGYKFHAVKSSSTELPSTAGATSSNFKSYTFPSNYILKAGKSVVLLFATSSTVADSIALATSISASFANATGKTGFIIADANNNVIDAVALNGATFNAASNVPSSVWASNNNLTMTGVAGVVRTANTATGWQVSSATNPMSMGATNSNLQIYFDNGCYGEKAPYNVVITNAPAGDVALLDMYVSNHENASSACGLGNETLTIKITNSGATPITETIPLVCNVYEGTTLVSSFTENYTSTLMPFDTLLYTFNSTIDMTAITAARDLHIVLNVDLASEVITFNDTIALDFTSLKTPVPPTVADLSIPYATSATLTAQSNDIVVWYEDATTTTELGRGTYNTPLLYENTTYYAGAILQTNEDVVVGTGTTANTASTYPAPFNCKQKQVKEQYLLRAADLIALGMEAGNLNSLSFNVSTVTVGSNQPAARVLDFNLKLTTTTQDQASEWFSNLTTVYTSDSIGFTSTSTGWKTLVFDTPYYWDGVSNLVVEVCFSSPNTNSSVCTYKSTTAYDATRSYRNASVNACSYTGNPTSTYQELPNMKFNVDKFGCSSTRVPLTVSIEQSPVCEVALAEIIEPNEEIVMSGIQVPVKVAIKNYGADALTDVTIKYTVNNGTEQVSNWTGNLASGEIDTVTLLPYIFNPGAITLTAYVEKDCDNVNTNDTASIQFSACLGNNTSAVEYTISNIAADNADYNSINEAILALEQSGVCGPVVFNIASATYNEQIEIPAINGVSQDNTITFKGVGATKPIITYTATGSTTNTTLVLNEASYISFENLDIQCASDAYPNMVVLNNTQDINFTDVVFSAPTATGTTLVSLTGQNINTKFENDEFYNGKVMLSSAPMPDDSLSNNIIINNCTFSVFTTGAIALDSYENVTISNNKIRAYAATVEGKAISVNNISGHSTINTNDIFVTESNKVRYGINIKRSDFGMMDPMLVYNNALGINGVTASTAIASMGIDVDSSSYVYVYYNTVRMKPSTNSQASVAMRVGAQASNIVVRNNNFENAGNGLAYQVQNTDAITISNNNNYYTTGTKFAYWGANIANLDALRTANSMDEASVSVLNPFESDSVLAIQYPTDIVYGAEPIEEVSVDKYGYTRPVSPHPTMGAYEYIFAENDAGVTQIIAPVYNNPYVENDPFTVTVSIKNFGSYSCNNINLVANLKSSANGTTLQTITGTYNQTLASMEEADYTFTAQMTPPLNDPYTDSLYLEVYTILENDTVGYNDTASVNIKVIPAYNIYLKKTVPITERCQLYSVPIKAEIQNKGEKTIDNTHTVYVTYEVVGRPDLTVTEQLNFPYTDPDLGLVQSLQKNATITYVFNQTANLYPTGTSDVALQLRTYTSFDLDHVPSGTNSNDTSAYITVNSRVSPNPPIGHNDTIYYGTIGHPSAEQENSLAIKWYYNQNDQDPIYAPSNYNTSKNYTTPDRMFQDHTYYLKVNLTGSYPCASELSEVQVVLRDRLPVDMAALSIKSPLSNPTTGYPNGLVYVEQDTVSIELVNYGTQNATNFEVSYQYKEGTNGTPVVVTETCHDVVAPDQTYVYKFNTLIDMPTTSTYQIIGWVKATGDIVETNDTVIERYDYKPTNGNTIYGNATVNNGESLDIVRVQMGTMDNSSVAGEDTYTNYTQSVDPVVLFRGTSDSLLVYNAKAPTMGLSQTPGGWMKVYIDWNRDGVFEGVTERVYSDTVKPDQSINRMLVNVPANNVYGKTRMRIMLAQDDVEHIFEANTAIPRGEIEDYLVDIRPIEDNNAQLVRFLSPERFVNEATQDIKLRLVNMGSNMLTSANITYIINGGATQTYNWMGNLMTSQTADIHITTTDLQYGNNTITAYVDAMGDNYHDNDTLSMNVFMFKTYSLSYAEDFDATSPMNDDFYAYELNPDQPTNCWQMGTPGGENTIITSAYSEPYCWKTNLEGKYPANNHSILYSPVFDIELIKPDTLAFMLRTVLGSAKLTVEYSDYRGDWQRIGDIDDSNGYNWYNNEDGFTGNNNSWKQVYYSLEHLLTNMGTKVQFRFIFKSGSGSTAEGAAIDNFELRRGLRPNDAGITSVELTPFLLPNYGSDFFPKVTIHNFGNEALSSVRVCYMAEDMHIPTCEDVYLADNPIPPSGDYEYIFQSGHYLDVSMPDPFTIVAFTRINQDLYQDNDSTWANIVIGPLEKDAAIVAIENPGAQIVSNDDVEIGIRVRNYGLSPITELPVAYSVSNGNVVEEVIYFNPPLYNGDEYVYKFNQRYHAPFGTVNLKTWVGLDGDFYHDNDTLYKRIEGTNYTQDIEARYITIDDANPSELGVQIAFLNRSSRGVGDITVGYFYDNDPTTAFEEIYRLGHVLPAGDYGYHYFTQKLPRRVYQSICAYVVVPNEVDLSNDTTYTIYMGYRDGVADTIFIEETVAEDCKIQLIGHNAGTLGGNTQVTAHLQIDGGQVITETFTWGYDEPNPEIREYMTFNYRIPKSANGQYNVKAWIDYPYDAAHWNDTTTIYQVKTFVGVEEIMADASGFILEQNSPNPLKDQTRIGFTLPQAGQIQFYVSNTIGQVIYSTTASYSEGHHYINFDAEKLEEGVYYYTMIFNGEKQMKKMIIIR